jgi:putative peptide zinc metalloprotease protein
LEAETVRLNALLSERERLTIRSPIAGELKELQSPVNVGDWLAESELLAVIVNPEEGIVEAFVGESDLTRLSIGVQGKFFPEDIQRSAFAVTLVQIDSASTTVLLEEYLASTQGGTIAVRQDGDGRLIPENPIYRVQAQSTGFEAAPRQQVRGTLHLDGKRISLIVRFWRSIYAVIVRESGF